MNDQRSSQLPDGFSQKGLEINVFEEKISPDARSKFAQSGVNFDGFAVADNDKSRREEVDEITAEIVKEGLAPEIKKLLGLDDSL